MATPSIEAGPLSDCDQLVYAYPTKSRCPECGSLDTIATQTPHPIQRRKCRTCHHNYKVPGWRI